MTTTDITRAAHDPAKRYTSVRLQAGRVLLDDDFNDSARITQHERAESLIDLIGPTGTSDNGLRISDVTTDDGVVDFALGSGTMYVAGRRLRVEPGQRYRHQDDWFSAPAIPVPERARVDLIWVELTERDVVAVEDRELFEVALGARDTASRTRLMSRIRVTTDVAGDCELAWQSTAGAAVNDRGELVSDARLAVSFLDDGPDPNPCSPEVEGGYLGGENQTIRVQAINGSEFTWGFDNASSLYRVELGADRTTIRFLTTPVDSAHQPRAGQVVELLAWSAVLPNGEIQAAATGALATVGQSYDPDSEELSLTAPVGPFGETDWEARSDAGELASGGRYVYLRVWDRGDDLSPPALDQNQGTAVPLGATGLAVTFNGTVRGGDHWVLAARPAEPNRVVPWSLADGCHPHGQRRFRAPLGLLVWDDNRGVQLRDCRRRFRPLTELQGCCVITVGDGDRSFGDVDSVQDAIDLLGPDGGRICVQAGRYEESIRIRDRRTVEIIGCGPDTVLVGVGNQPVVRVDGSRSIRLASMRLQTTEREAVLIGSERACGNIELDSLTIGASAFAPGVRAMSPNPAGEPTVGVTITDCLIETASLIRPPEEGRTIELWPALWLQGNDLAVERTTVRASVSKLTGALGGIQIAGLSNGVMLRHNTVEGGNGNGITLGSIQWLDREGIESVDNDYVRAVGRAVDRGWFTWFDGGCITVGEADPADDDPRQPDPYPVSTGPVENIVIADNRITRMAADGITVARFFDLTDALRADLITTDNLVIERNHILHNRRTRVPALSPSRMGNAGFGGIALASTEHLLVRTNTIIDNGSVENDPLCGIFVLDGSGIVIDDNEIVGNGMRPGLEAPARLGNRGGIVVKSCRDLSLDDDSPRPKHSVGALTVHRNRVAQPVGQALWASGLGRFLIHDNQLSAGGLGLTQLLEAVIELLDGDLDDTRAMGALFTTHMVGSAVTIINLGLAFDLVSATTKYRDFEAPTGLRNVAMSVGSADSKQAREHTEKAMNEEARSVGGPNRYRLATNNSLLSAITGGHISFNDNQVALDLLEATSAATISSVLIASLDEAAVHDNQFRCLTNRDVVLVDVLALALLSLRCQGNRVQDSVRVRNSTTRVQRGGALISLATWALLNITTDNITTNLWTAATGASGQLVDQPNLRLI